MYINNWAVQSYFKNLSNSYCVILNELKRLRQEQKRIIIEEMYTEKELESIKAWLKVDWESFINKKWGTPNISKEEVEALLEKYSQQERKQKAENAICIGQIQTWNECKLTLRNQITWMISQLEPETLIITTEEEIITLIDCYHNTEKFLEKRIINTESMYLESFPKETQMCINFYQYYLLKDNIGMDELYEEYIK